jgi:hypothetical protein
MTDNGNDIGIILGVILLAYVIEYFQFVLNLSVFNVFLFINLIGLYYISRKLKVSITIEYNSDIIQINS